MKISSLSFHKDQFNEAYETFFHRNAWNYANLNSFQALAGLVEIPAIGIAMYIIMKTGKKWLFSATFLATAISCFFAAIFEGNEHMLWMKITFVMIGKL